jgi:hypothetical protein
VFVNIFMDSKLEKYIIALLLIILISLAACAKPAKEYKPGPFGVVVDHAESVGTMIGCMFNPKVCQEALEDKDWEKVDQELQKSK